MKKTTIILFAALFMYAAAVLADDTKCVNQTLTVDETEIQKTVSEIRFDGNNAILLFSDKSTLTVDMQQVRLSLSYDEETGLNSLRLDDAEGTRVYDLSGRKVNANSLRDGVYIINGKKYFNQKK